MATEDMGAELVLHFYKTVEQNVYAKMRLNIPKKISFFTSVIQLAINSWQRLLFFSLCNVTKYCFSATLLKWYLLKYLHLNYLLTHFKNQVIIKHIHHPTN